MLITPYLNGERFQPETKRVLDVALTLVCTTLRIEGSGNDVKQLIANKIIAFAKADERDPAILCERVLEDIRRPPPEV